MVTHDPRGAASAGARRIELVYGETGNRDLVFVPRARALQPVGVRMALASARTWGELRTCLMEDLYLFLVQALRDEEELPEEWMPEADLAFSPEALPGYEEMQWPDWLAQQALEWLPSEIQERYGIVIESTHDGHYLEIAPAGEGGIVRDLEASGYRCTRDGLLVRQATDLAEPG